MLLYFSEICNSMFQATELSLFTFSNKKQTAKQTMFISVQRVKIFPPFNMCVITTPIRTILSPNEKAIEGFSAKLTD